MKQKLTYHKYMLMLKKGKIRGLMLKKLTYEPRTSLNNTCDFGLSKHIIIPNRIWVNAKERQKILGGCINFIPLQKYI